MTRNEIKKLIDRHTSYDVSTVKFHRDGTISAIRDADKTFNAPESTRLIVCHVGDFDAGENPFVKTSL